MALTAGAGFVAQGFSSDLKQLTRLIEEGLRHKGFSLINVYSPCVTYNKINTYDWFKEHLVNLDQEEGYDPSNRMMAMQKLMETEGLVTGLIYQNKERSSYEELIPGFRETGLAKQDLGLEREKFDQLVAEFS